MIIPDMRIKAITFDWGDTLAANHSMPYTCSQDRALAALGLSLCRNGHQTPPDWAKSCLEELRSCTVKCMDPEQNPNHQEIDLEGMLQGWIERSGAKPSAEEREQACLDCLYQLSNVVVPFVGAVETLAQLKTMGYRIGILSHVPWPRRGCEAWYQRHGFADLIDFYSLSSEVGWIKPNPLHYQDALDQAACQVDEILHVGDHPQRDIVGPKAFGMHTCLKLTEGIYPHSALENCMPDYRIMHVKELPELLAKS